MSVLDIDYCVPDDSVYLPEYGSYMPAWAYALAMTSQDFVAPFDRCWCCDKVSATTDVGLCDLCRAHLRCETDQSC